MNKKVIAAHDELINRVTANRALWDESESVLMQLSSALNLKPDIVVLRGKKQRSK